MNYNKIANTNVSNNFIIETGTLFDCFNIVQNKPYLGFSRSKSVRDTDIASCYIDNGRDNIVKDDPNYDYYWINTKLPDLENTVSYIDLPDTMVKYYEKPGFNIENKFYLDPIPNMKLTGTLNTILNQIPTNINTAFIFSHKDEDKDNPNGNAYVYRYFLNTIYFKNLLTSFCKSKGLLYDETKSMETCVDSQGNITNYGSTGLINDTFKAKYYGQDVTTTLNQSLVLKTLPFIKTPGYTTYITFPIMKNQQYTLTEQLDIINSLVERSESGNVNTPTKKAFYKVDESKLNNEEKQLVIKRSLNNVIQAFGFLTALETNIKTIVITDKNMFLYPFVVSDDKLIPDVMSNTYTLVTKDQYKVGSNINNVTREVANTPSISSIKVYDYLQSTPQTSTTPQTSSGNSNNIIFIVIGSIFGFIIISLVVYFLYTKYANKLF